MKRNCSDRNVRIVRKIIILLILVMSLYPQTVSAADDTEKNDFQYSVLSDGTIEITGYTGSEEEDLIIPDSIDGRNVTRIGDRAFYRLGGNAQVPKNFKGKLKLSKGLKSIGNEAFSGCSFNGELELPDGLTTIGDSAFEKCSSFTGGLNLPDNVTSIGNTAFYMCSGFTGDLKLPKGLTSIRRGTFSMCSGFTGELNLPEGIKTIERSAFFSCSGFKGNLNLPNSLTSISESAFHKCNGFIGELKLPDNLSVIGTGTFGECSGFTGLVLPPNITSIGERAFYKCSGLICELTFPEGLADIGASAFRDCQGLTGSLEIPENIESVGEYAFSGCGYDDTLILSSESSYPKKIKIGAGAFGGLAVKRIDNQRDCELDVNQFDYANDSRWYSEREESVEFLPVEGMISLPVYETLLRVPREIEIGYEPSELKIGEKAYPDTNLDAFNDLLCEWRSSDRQVAEVDKDGVVTGVGEGTVVISASIMGEVTGEETVEVMEPEKEEPVREVTGIKLSGLSGKIAAGKKIRLKADVVPADAANKNITWKSSNKKIAKVNRSGVVTLNRKSGGKKVTITATAPNGVKAAYKITSMKGIVKKIEITGKKTVGAGKALKLKAKVTATPKANKKLKWKSSNTKYAAVNASGKVKAKKAGKGKNVKITAMATDGSGKKKTVNIKIK